MSFVDDVTIHQNDLAGEYQKQAALFALYAQKLADAEGEYNVAKTRLAAIQDKLFLFYIKKLEEENGKKPTEAMIKASIGVDETFHEAQGQLLDAQKAKSNAKVRVDALVQKKDMLQQMGATHRKEMDALHNYG